MDTVILGAAVLAVVALVIIGMVIYAVGPLLAILVLGGSCVLTGMIYAGVNLIAGGC